MLTGFAAPPAAAWAQAVGDVEEVVVTGSRLDVSRSSVSTLVTSPAQTLRDAAPHNLAEGKRPRLSLPRFAKPLAHGLEALPPRLPGFADNTRSTCASTAASFDRAGSDGGMILEQSLRLRMVSGMMTRMIAHMVAAH